MGLTISTVFKISIQKHKKKCTYLCDRVFNIKFSDIVLYCCNVLPWNTVEWEIFAVVIFSLYSHMVAVILE